MCCPIIGPGPGSPPPPQEPETGTHDETETHQRADPNVSGQVLVRPKVHLEQPEQPPKEATHRPAQGMLEEQSGGGEGGATSCPPGELVEQGPGQAPPCPAQTTGARPSPAARIS